MNTRSWQKNSFGLFDFESREVFESHLTHIGTGQIIRDETLNVTDRRRITRLNIRAVQGEKPVSPVKNERS